MKNDLPAATLPEVPIELPLRRLGAVQVSRHTLGSRKTKSGGHLVAGQPRQRL